MQCLVSVGPRRQRDFLMRNPQRRPRAQFEMIPRDSSNFIKTARSCPTRSGRVPLETARIDREDSFNGRGGASSSFEKQFESARAMRASEKQYS